jgi:hypothetical protein
MLGQTSLYHPLASSLELLLGKCDQNDTVPLIGFKQAMAYFMALGIALSTRKMGLLLHFKRIFFLHSAIVGR